MFWYNGNFIENNFVGLSINDPGLLYGATVFTTLRIYQQSLDHPLTNWQQHCDRLRTSLQDFDWQSPDWERVKQGCETLLPSFPVLRITLFPDGREWITGRLLPSDLLERQQRGITAWLATDAKFIRAIPNHKTGNYLPAWLALNQAQKLGAKEAILVNSSNHWLETSSGNLWGWLDGKWYTPPLEVGILPGIARSQMINWLKSQNEQVVEIPWENDWVSTLEVLAYTNSVVEVIPIHTVLNQNHPLTYNPLHPSLERLRELWSINCKF